MSFVPTFSLLRCFASFAAPRAASSTKQLSTSLNTCDQRLPTPHTA